MKKLLLLMVGILLCLPACGLLKKRVKVVQVNRDVRLAGRVERVDSVSSYVLIRRYGAWKFDPEIEFAESRGEGRTANLLPTGEKLGEYIAADIRSGSIEVGDAVYIRRLKVSKVDELSDKPKESSFSKNKTRTRTKTEKIQ